MCQQEANIDDISHNALQMKKMVNIHGYFRKFMENGMKEVIQVPKKIHSFFFVTYTFYELLEGICMKERLRNKEQSEEFYIYPVGVPENKYEWRDEAMVKQNWLRIFHN